ncbi:hypothetical protein HBA54_07210 [Pelagibius litoralis]|uniref:Uncharacterized protein n=1 Tax=Pelagibius litoralis TaxID=374515 RepID=A0A967C8G0_9PROT|nr:hypothetical protein [Pelagibius litoralis]NIA68377.1 hypothetical protein [Pelagibius litoralis]
MTNPIIRRQTLAGRLAALLLALAVLTPGGATAAPADLAGWGAARWGMTGPELEEALGDAVAALPGRWLYGGAYAELGLPDVEIGGLAFTGYLQMDAKTDRLRQVLLERRRVGATPAAFERLVEALEVTYGKPSLVCSQAKRGGAPLDYEMIWRFATTTLHAKFLDFSTTAAFGRDPQAGIDPLTPEREVRRNLRRFMPRRILLRFHDSRESDLDRGCP